jgi:hypothetical protein
MGAVRRTWQQFKGEGQIQPVRRANPADFTDEMAQRICEQPGSHVTVAHPNDQIRMFYYAPLGMTGSRPRRQAA